MVFVSLVSNTALYQLSRFYFLFIYLLLFYFPELQRMLWCERLLLPLLFGTFQWHFTRGLPHNPSPLHAFFNTTVQPSPSSLDPSLSTNHTPQTKNPCIAKSLKAWDGEGSDQIVVRYQIEVEDPKECKGPPICDDGGKLTDMCRCAFKMLNS